MLAEDRKRGNLFTRLGAFYDDTLYAGLTLNDYDIYFDGTKCKMCGVGGVISDFNSPYKGGVKQLFKRSFELMRENNQYISHLYPFEESYYRQYGYDVSCQRAVWKIPVDKLYYMKSGIVKPYDGSDKMKEDIIKVFNVFSKKNNLLMLKNKFGWESFFEQYKPYSSGNNSFVHYSADGHGDAFMSYRVETYTDKPNVMNITEFWYESFDALKGMLSYFETQRPYCDLILLPLSENTDISPIINSTGGNGKWDTERTVKNKGSSRIVDVEEVLKMAKYKGEGVLGIKIYDDVYAPWNNDCFTVGFGRQTTVTRGGTPDIEMKITSFSSAILGRMNSDNLEMFPDVKIINYNNIDKVFYKKNMWIEEHF